MKVRYKKEMKSDFTARIKHEESWNMFILIKMTSPVHIPEVRGRYPANCNLEEIMLEVPASKGSDGDFALWVSGWDFTFQCKQEGWTGQGDNIPHALKPINE